MSNNSTDCISSALSQAVLSNITACQTAATTPFCWPPNGTRICVPTSTIPFYWPTTYYNDTNTYIGIIWDLADYRYPVGINNGIRDQEFTPDMYKYQGLSIPLSGKKNEKTLTAYMRSRKIGKAELGTDQGPTIVLVKTAEFSRTASTATGTSKPYSGSDDDDRDALTGLTSGGMAGIIVGVLVAIVALITACCCFGCCACCGVKKGARRQKFRVDREEQERRVALGTELMKQRGGVGGKVEESQGRAIDVEEGMRGTGVQDDEITRVEQERVRVDEEVVRDYINPPPKYSKR